MLKCMLICSFVCPFGSKIIFSILAEIFKLLSSLSQSSNSDSRSLKYFVFFILLFFGVYEYPRDRACNVALLAVKEFLEYGFEVDIIQAKIYFIELVDYY